MTVFALNVPILKKMEDFLYCIFKTLKILVSVRLI